MPVERIPGEKMLIDWISDQLRLAIPPTSHTVWALIALVGVAAEMMTPSSVPGKVVYIKEELSRSAQSALPDHGQETGTRQIILCLHDCRGKQAPPSYYGRVKEYLASMELTSFSSLYLDFQCNYNLYYSGFTNLKRT